jgi:hypothetical protein
MSQVVQCQCGATQGIWDEHGNAICHPCYNAIVEAKNVAVQDLFEARQRIAELERQACQLKQGS